MAAKNTFRTSFFTKFCTSGIRKGLGLKDFGPNPKRKAAAEKSLNRAGATPLFGLQTAQNAFGVAPALLRCFALVIFPRLGTDSDSTTKGHKSCLSSRKHQQSFRSK